LGTNLSTGTRNYSLKLKVLSTTSKKYNDVAVKLLPKTAMPNLLNKFYKLKNLP